MRNAIKAHIEKARCLLDAARDALCIMDLEGNILYFNPYYENMKKRNSAELVADESDIVLENQVIGKMVIYHDMSEINRLKRELDTVNQKLRVARSKYTFDDIIGSNAQLLKVIKTAKIAANTPATILIGGESGTGKEIFANAIHNSSPRRNEKLVKVNCSAFSEELLESELFGYKEGAFTGAKRGGRKGLFREANNGTLFLDEIGDISPKMQVKLLRVLQEKEVVPVGSNETIEVDVRIISATNKNLEKLMEEGTFREDLYYRLNVFPLSIPPLRERKEDVPDISMYIARKYNELYDRKVERISDKGKQALRNHPWPGNVRELENVLSRVLIHMNAEETEITEEHIKNILGEGKLPSGEKETLGDEMPINIKEAVELTERHCIKRALKESNGNKNIATNLLGIPLRTMYYKCKKLEI